MDNTASSIQPDFQRSSKIFMKRKRSLGTDNRAQYIAYLLIVNAHLVLFIGMVNTFSVVLLGNACRLSEDMICNSYLKLVCK